MQPAFEPVASHAGAEPREADWVRDLEAQIAGGRAEIDRLSQENSRLENTVVERTKWAQSLDAELQALEQAKLVRLGRKLKLIPGKPA